MLHEAFVSALASRRAEYNAQFLAARRASPELQDEAFKEFLARSVDPLVAAVAAIDRAAVVEVVDTAYAVGLELLSQRLAGPRAIHSILDQAFRELFPALAPFVARAPGAVLPRLCNALQQLATTPGARPAEFSAALARLAAQVDDVDTLLRVGQVCGWLSGLAHYRPSALEVCRGLRPALALSLLGAPGGDVARVLARLEQDPWFVPSAPELGLRVVGRVGGFRGFGGGFLSLPRVLRVGRELFVQSGEDAWLLTLDAFGCTFHRAQPEELVGARSDHPGDGVLVEPARVVARGKTLPLLHAGPIESVAGNGSTVLFSTSQSYAITIVALEPSG